MKHNFRQLNIWQRSMSLVEQIYAIRFPMDERYNLSSQVRRAAISVPSNLAEGCGRKGEKELIQFCHIATGSLCELETQMILSSKLSFISNESAKKIINEIVDIRKMIYSFIKSIKSE